MVLKAKIKKVLTYVNLIEGDKSFQVEVMVADDLAVPMLGEDLPLE